LNGKTRSRKIDPSNVLTNKEDKTLVVWIFVYARIWIFHYLTIVQNKGVRTYSNQTYPFQRWVD
jgi:hypothetical protein